MEKGISSDTESPEDDLSTELEGGGEPDLQAAGFDSITPSLEGLLDKPANLDTRGETVSELRTRRRSRRSRRVSAIRPEDIQAKMRFVARLTTNQKPGTITVGYINVERLAMSIFKRFYLIEYVFSDPGFESARDRLASASVSASASAS